MFKEKAPINHYNNIQQKILSMASFFNDSFSVGWLMQLSGLRVEDILSVLETGVDNDLLKKEGPGRFSFKDNDLLTQLRQTHNAGEITEIHQDIVNILLKESNEDTDTLLTAADFLINLNTDIDSCRWLLKAGNQYRRTFRYKKALRCYKKVIRDLDDNNSDEAILIFVEATIGYSRISDAEPDPEVVSIALKKAIPKAKMMGNQTLLSILEMHMAKSEWYLSKFKSSLNHFNCGWAIAKELNDPGLNRSISSYTNLFLYNQNRYKEVVENYEKSVPDIGRYPKTRVSILAGWATGISYGVTGDVRQGIGILDSLYNHYEYKGDVYIESLLALGIGIILSQINLVEEAEKYLLEAEIKANEAPNHIALYYSLASLAVGYLYKDVKKAIYYLDKCLQLAKQLKLEASHLWPLFEIGWLMEKNEIPRLPNFSFKNLLDSALNEGYIIAKGIAYRFMALIQRENKEPHENVIKTLLSSVTLIQTTGFQIELAKTKIELIREYLSIKQVDDAKKTMLSLIPIFDVYGEHLLPEDLKFLCKNIGYKKNVLQEIMKLSQEIVSIRDNRELAAHILSTASRITGAERSAIFLFNKNISQHKPIIRASRNLSEEDISSPSFENSMKMIIETFTKDKGRIHKAASTTTTSPNKDKIIRDCICVPMKIRDEVVGVLYNDNKVFRNPFKEADLDTLSYFASQVAIAMDNAEAYEKIRILNEELSLENKYYGEQESEVFHFEEIIGKSEKIKNMLSQITQVANTDANVLILGETGAGKELVARAIHRLSDRKEKPFIRVNCTAFPETLISSELFGHEKGAFTGATERRIGRFEMANKGTIFLDEIGDVPLDVQVHLLRILQHKEFERIGGKMTIQSDFRLIAATNRDLYNDVKKNKFREDLYYRLNVFPIHLPPLRERKDDIPLLAYYFLNSYSAKFKINIEKILKTDMDRLIEYDWPGNVRELENVIERGVIISSGSIFRMPELVKRPVESADGKEMMTFKEMESNYIVHTLKATQGKVRGKGGAAEIMDIHPNTLYSKMRRLGIQKP